MLGSLATGSMALSGCVGRFGSNESYLTPILKPANNNIVTYWLDVLMQQVRDQRVTPPRAAYNFALPLVAGFMAANSIIQKYDDPYGVGIGPRDADPEVAYGVAFGMAAAEVFQQPFIGERIAFKNRFTSSHSKSLGIEWGRKVGRHILKLRTRDGSQPSKVNYYLGRYPRRKDSLKWTPTGPLYSAKPGPAFDSFGRGLFPGQGHIKPWTMTSGSQFRADDFYDPASPEFAEEFEKISQLGGANSTIRTADQSEIALFWEDGPWGITPPGHFLLIAIQLLQERGLSFIDQARAFALIGMTQCDASINAWDNKYHHDIIRPETAIRHRADSFGNTESRVVRQKHWRSYIPTPGFPAYTSGHSTFGAAGAHMISHFLGTDQVRFSHQSPDQVLWPQLRNVTRHWTSLSQAAEENGMSRLYGGVHWELDHKAAMRAGHQIADHAIRNVFKPRV